MLPQKCAQHRMNLSADTKDVARLFFFFQKQNQRPGRPPGRRAINISFSSRMNLNRWTKHAGQRCQLMIRILSPPGRGDMSPTICHQHCMTGKGSSEWMPYIIPLSTPISTGTNFPKRFDVLFLVLSLVVEVILGLKVSVQCKVDSVTSKCKGYCHFKK